jgi:hypothetical protein
VKYPTCNFSLMTVNDISKFISRKANQGEPFSLIGLSDGEGLLLSITSESPESDFRYLTGHIGPLGMDAEVVINLRDNLVKAIQESDIIGVRNDIVDVNFGIGNFSLPEDDFLGEFRKNFQLREVEKALPYHPSKRIASLHKCLADLDFRENVQFCSAWVHYDFHTSGAIFDLLKQQTKIELISCRSKLPSLLEDVFKLCVKYVEIPNMYGDVHNPESPLAYISQFENVLSQRLVEHPGMVYLVGGGLYGKLFCNLIRSQGGIAIDLGSLFDAWLGIPSRRLVYLSMFDMASKENEVPAQLLLTAEDTCR